MVVLTVALWVDLWEYTLAGLMVQHSVVLSVDTMVDLME